MKRSLLLLSVLLSGVLSVAQTYNIGTLNGSSILTCSGTFVDDGGSAGSSSNNGAGNYSNNASQIITFCPSTAGDVIQVTFTYFNVKETNGSTRTCEDWLNVYQGNATYAASNGADDVYCGELLGTQLPTITSTSADGCITFEFESNGSQNRGGWVATIGCVTPCQSPTAAFFSTTPIYICPNTAVNGGIVGDVGNYTVDFNASSSTVGTYTAPTSHSLVSYSWDFGDGATSTTGTATTTHTYSTPGVYKATVSVIDNNTDVSASGCASTNSALKEINVVPAPSITDVSAPATCGNCVDIAATGTSQTAAEELPLISVTPTALPDGNGTCYTSSVDFGGFFNTGATVSSTCYPTVTFDIDHSWSRDLTIELIAPSGESVILFNRSGIPGMLQPSYKFGDCTPAADDGAAGCPGTYVVVGNGTGQSWTNYGATIGTTATTSCGGITCETGTYYIQQTYNSAQPFSLLDGADLNGTWSLRICDNQSLDDGTLHDWSLSFPSTCLKSLTEITPDLSSIAWAPVGGAPAINTTNCTNTSIFAPGPDACPSGQTCEGDSIRCVANVCIPAATAGTFDYQYTITDEYGCQYQGQASIVATCACASSATMALSGATTICEGESTELTFNFVGAGDYNVTYTDGTSNFTINSVSDGHTVLVSPTTNTTYSLVSFFDNGSSCNNSVSSTVNVTVNAVDDPSFTLTNYCEGAANSATITGTAGGTFTFDPVPTDGASISASTGTITNGVGGTSYSIQYATGGTCPDSITQNVTVNALEDASFTMSNYCEGAANTATITGTTGGTFTFEPVPTDGASISASTGAITNGVGGTSYTIQYLTGGTCPDSTTQSVTVNTQDDASFTYSSGTFCESGTDPSATILGTSGGSFSGTGALSINATTGLIDLDLSGVGTYTVSYQTVGVCPDNATFGITITSVPDATFSYAGPYCQNGTANATFGAGASAGVFSSTSGLGLNTSTGDINLAASTPGTYSVTNNISVAGCAPATANASITINASDDPSFVVTNYCEGAANSATITGTAGGTFTFDPIPTDGASISASTGAITNGVGGTSYTIQYLTGGTCPDSTTQNITVNALEDASFTLSNYCEGTANSANIIGTTGGTFTFEPVPTDGASISASTGAITNGVGGTSYTIQYLTGGTCPDSTTQNVTVNALDDASFTLSNYCEGTTNSATIIGTAGGTFTFEPVPTDGASISASTGAITNGVGGASYTIQYLTGGTCPDSTTQNITVNAIDDPSFALANYCEGAANSAIIIGTAGGTFTFEPVPTDGATISASTGTITNGVGGTSYTIQYLTAGTCPDSSTQNVTVNAVEDASFTLSNYCEGAANTATITGTTGGTFTFEPVPTDGATISASTGAITNGVGGTTYTVQYLTGGTCADSTTQSITVNAVDDPSFTISSFCVGSASAPVVTGTAGGTFSFSPDPADGATINSTTGLISNAVAGSTYTVQYVTNGTCPDSTTQQVNVTSEDDASFIFNSFCADSTNAPQVTGVAGGTFSFETTPTDGATINTATGTITGSTSGATYSVIYLTPAGACQSSDTVVVAVGVADNADFVASNFCVGDSNQVAITGTGNGVFSFNPAVTDGASIDPITGHISNAVAQSVYTVQYATQGACPDVSLLTVIAGGVVADFEPSTSFGEVPLTVSFDNLSVLDSGATMLWDFGNGENATSFEPTTTYDEAGNYVVTLIVTSGLGCADTATYEEIVVIEGCTLSIPTAFTPDADDVNDLWVIRCFDQEQDAHVVVLNRWGATVYESEGGAGYQAWDGKGPGGSDLPSASYFYIVKVGDEEYKGTITLIR